MAQKQDKINGTGKVILLRLDNIDTTLQEIKVQLCKMAETQTVHSVNIKGIEKEQDATAKNLQKHESEHTTFAGLVVSASGIIAAVVMFIINLFIKTKN